MKRVLVALMLPALAIIPACNKNQAGNAATTQPSTAPATATTAPASAPSVVARIGAKTITDADVQKLLAPAMSSIPADRMDDAKKDALDGLILKELISTYLKKIDVTAEAADVAEIKAQLEDAAKEEGVTPKQFMEEKGLTDDTLKDMASLRKLTLTELSDEKAKDLIKQHPEYFNGTTLKATHILVVSSPMASTKDQLAARAKLEAIVKDLSSGKLTFEDAVKKYPEPPAGATPPDGTVIAQNLDNGFAFQEMDPAFSATAFAAKPGATSEIIQSSFGWHVLKVTARTEGKDDPYAAPTTGPAATQPAATAPATGGPREPNPTVLYAAKTILYGQFQAKVFSQTLNDVPLERK